MPECTLEAKMSPKVTILIPHYKTLKLTKLCLRLIRHYTTADLAHVIVIDNDSKDSSLDYLRSLSWIELIERLSIPNEGAISAHSRALDLGLLGVTTPYVLSIHTDTLVKQSGWLEYLINHLDKNPNVAGVGSWKLENKPYWRQSLKHIERYLQLAFYFIQSKTQHVIEGKGKNFLYLRSHCALYRMDFIKRYGLQFSDEDMVAGRSMHQKLVQAGHDMIFLPSEELIYYLEHLNHATTVLNPALSTRARSITKGVKRIESILTRLHADLILENDQLDR